LRTTLVSDVISGSFVLRRLALLPPGSQLQLVASTSGSGTGSAALPQLTRPVPVLWHGRPRPLAHKVAHFFHGKRQNGRATWIRWSTGLQSLSSGVCVNKGKTSCRRRRGRSPRSVADGSQPAGASKYDGPYYRRAAEARATHSLSPISL
jgi:hypothetical protein